jgi:hypothetical protein
VPIAVFPALAEISNGFLAEADYFLLIDRTVRTTKHTNMDIVASAQAAATLAGMFLEAVQVTEHVIETMKEHELL